MALEEKISEHLGEPYVYLREQKKFLCKNGVLFTLEDYKNGLSWFEKAAATSGNLFSAGYLLKAAAVAEKLGDTAKALGLYKTIKDKYPSAPEAMDIDKYISRIEFTK